MKRIFLICICIIAIQTTMIAGPDKAIRVDQLPNKAQTLINTYFSGVKVSYAKMDKELFNTDYEVFFTNGTKIEFNRKGDWKDIECRDGIPDGLIPPSILEFINEHHAGQKITDIDHDSDGYEVKLDNRIELKFDRKARMIGYDD